MRTKTPLLASALCVLGAVGVAVASGPAGSAAASAPQVLRVGTYNNIPGTYSSIQAAVDAAAPGDWVLVGPGDYKERGDYTTHQTPGAVGNAVEIIKPGLHLRGMNRNTVIVDGTKPGAPACSAAAGDQDYGPGTHPGRNGIRVFKADGTSIENLTSCNFQGGNSEIWFNGGDGSGTVGLGAFLGQYITGTTSFYAVDKPQASYGIFVSNSKGPGLIAHAYASNMNDSSFYVGACPDCNTVLDDVHAQNSALGYSGTNSGGHLIIKNSEWDNNATGLVSNSQNNDDAPSPQDGACPNGGTGPTGSHSCEIWINNNVHDNNNPNVPKAGSASAGPVGTGMVVAGGRNITIVGNNVHDNKAWGILTVPYPDTGPPPAVANCAGGASAGQACYFDDWGNEIAHNVLSNNGGYGNVTNGDLGDLSQLPSPTEAIAPPGNCWHDNTDPAGSVSQEPPTLQTLNATCGQPVYGDPLASSLGAQVACDTEALSPCPDNPVASYPRTTTVALMPLVAQTTMPNPCLDVPANPWCPANPAVRGGSGGKKHAAKPVTAPGRSLASTGEPLGVALLAGGAAGLGIAGLSLRRRRTS